MGGDSDDEGVTRERERVREREGGRETVVGNGEGREGVGCRDGMNGMRRVGRKVDGRSGVEEGRERDGRGRRATGTKRRKKRR